MILLLVWQQLLHVVIGSAPVAGGVSLAALTGGISLGAFMVSRVSGHRHRLRIASTMHIWTALSALLVLFVLPYVAGINGFLMRAMISAVIVLLPSLFLGASLATMFHPVLFVIGACETLLAGFYLLRVYDVVIATSVAVVIHLTAALIAFLLSRNSPRRRLVVHSARDVGSVYTSVWFSGLGAFGSIVVWNHLLSLELGRSVYTFPLVLSVFLFGLGLGAAAGGPLANRSARPRLGLAICQMAAAAGTAWSAHMLVNVLPYWPIDPRLYSTPVIHFQMDVFRCVWVILPSASFWGASLVFAFATTRSRVRTLSMNMFGASVGVVIFMLMIPLFGTTNAQKVLIGASAAAALLAITAFSWRAVVATAAAGALLIFTVSATPQAVIAYGRSLAWQLSNTDSVTRDYFVPKILAAAEGTASVAVSETSLGVRSLHVDGTINGSSSHQDIRLHRMLGHLPALLHARPRSVLLAGFGAGLVAGSLSNHPTIERIVICEPMAESAKMVPGFFAMQNSNILEDPRVEVVHDDARHFLLTTAEKFDVITAEPIPPWAPSSAGLLTREYFEIVKEHLNPGGIVAQGVPLRNNTEESVKSSLATFFELFPGARLFSNDAGGRAYDLIVLGGDPISAINPDEIQTKLSRRDHANVIRSLQESGFGSAMKLFATHDGRASDLVPWLANATINRDRNLKVLYLAGLGMNLANEGAIYDSLLRYRRPVVETFGGSPGALDELTRAVEDRRPRLLSTSEASAITNTLVAHPGRRISISSVIGDREALEYATALRESILAGGWQIGKIRQSEFSDSVTGLQIFVGSDPPPREANELFQALRAAGLAVEGNFDPKANPNSVLLVVGAHP